MSGDTLRRVLYSPITPCVILPLDAYVGARLLVSGHTALGTFTTACAALLALHILTRARTRRRKQTQTGTA